MQPPPRNTGNGLYQHLPNPAAASLFSRRLPGSRQNFQWSSQNLSLTSIVPPPRSGAASVVVNGKLYVFGVSYDTYQSNSFFCDVVALFKRKTRGDRNFSKIFCTSTLICCIICTYYDVFRDMEEARVGSTISIPLILQPRRGKKWKSMATKSQKVERTMELL